MSYNQFAICQCNTVGFHTKKLTNWIGFIFISQTRSFVSLDEVVSVPGYDSILEPIVLLYVKNDLPQALSETGSLYGLITLVFFTNINISRNMKLLWIKNFLHSTKGS